MNFDQLVLSAHLRRAMEQFDTNPVCASLMRRFAKEFPTEFLTEALKYVESDGQSRAHKYLATLLIRHPLIFDRITNPAHGSVQRAVMLLNRLMQVNPGFDLEVARQLPDGSGSNHRGAFDIVCSLRALDVLAQRPPSSRLLPVIAHLVNSPEADPRTCAKATLLMGRTMQRPEWVAKQLKIKEDPRVRANALESIWGLNSPPAKTLFEDFAHDSCNRVAGNALMGLHIVGGGKVVGEIASMADSPRTGFRSTAAWSMGKICDSTFVPCLQTLLRDDQPQVRGSAVRALALLRDTQGPKIKHPGQQISK